MTPHVDIVYVCVIYFMCAQEFGAVGLVIAHTQYLLQLEDYRWLHV